MEKREKKAAAAKASGGGGGGGGAKPGTLFSAVVRSSSDLEFHNFSPFVG